MQSKQKKHKRVLCCCCGFDFKKSKTPQVYAVEFTDMAHHARRLVAKNGMEDIVEVIQCSVEDLKLDAKVMLKFCAWWAGGLD